MSFHREPGPESARTASLAVVAGFGLLTIYFSGVFPPFANPNEVSRLETVYAAVEQGTLRIDRALEILGDHEDKAVSGGHFYSNKPPGLALAAIPVYRLLRIFLPAPRHPWDPIFVLLRILTVSLLTVFALSTFAARLSRTRAGPLVTFAVAFGTPLHFYARTFFAHAWAAALLFLAWDRLDPRRPGGARYREAFAGGLLAGWAAISEYTTVPLALVLLGVLARTPRRLLAALAGLAVPLAVLLVYDAVCFGSPFVLSSAREGFPDYARLAGQGVFGLGLPSGATSVRFLLHPARGLLVFSTFGIWAAPGFIRWWRSGADRSGALAAGGGVLLFFVLLTGYPNWHGGWALGSRYLLPATLLTAVAIPFALESPLSRGLFAIAASVSAALHFLLTASWPNFPASFGWPPANGSVWFLAHGWVAPNLLGAAGAPSLLIPAAVFATCGALAVRAGRPMTPSPALGAAAALVFSVAVLARPTTLPFGARLWRAAVFGAYSGRDPERRQLSEVARSATDAREVAQAQDAWRLFGPK